MKNLATAFLALLGTTVGIANEPTKYYTQPSEGGTLPSQRCVYWLSRVEAMREAWGDPGLAFAVIEGDQIWWAEGFGTLRRGDSTPVTGQTLFPVGSITKSFTAAAALQLVHEGKLGLEIPVRLWLTDMQLANEQVTQQLTLSDLLTHQTGFHRREGDLAVAFGYDADTFYERLRYLPLRHELRSGFNYSNWNYFLAGRLIEAATGQSFTGWVDERFLKPLGSMGGFDLASVDVPQGHFWEIYTDGSELRPMDPWDLRAIAPAGGLYASVEDLAYWISVHLQKGQLDGQQLLDPWVVEVMQTPMIEMDRESLGWWHPELGHGGELHYGFGWTVQKYMGRKLVGHLGVAPGYTVSLSFMPEENIGIVVASSSYRSLLPVAVQLDFYQRWLTGDWCGSGRWSDRLLGKRDAWLEMQQQLENDLEQNRIGCEPVVALADCCGTYTHPFYGTLELTLDGSCWGSQLRLMAGPAQTAGRVIHWAGNNLRLYWRSLPVPPLFLAEVVGQDGTLRGLQLGPVFLQREGVPTILPMPLPAVRAADFDEAEAI
jgi:CubicO group peptidase (beta-lactamase class C family)